MIETTRAAFVLLLSGDPALWQIIGISLKTAIIGLMLVSPLAVTCCRSPAQAPMC
jgi:tungstate transport system permease protein